MINKSAGVRNVFSSAHIERGRGSSSEVWHNTGEQLSFRCELSPRSNFDITPIFGTMLVGKSLQKVMLLQKRTPIVVWIVKPTMAAARLPLQCCLLALANQHSAKNGRNIEV